MSLASLKITDVRSLKKAALDAKPKPPRGGRFQREQAAASRSGSKSKPWMSR